MSASPIRVPPDQSGAARPANSSATSGRTFAAAGQPGQSGGEREHLGPGSADRGRGVIELQQGPGVRLHRPRDIAEHDESAVTPAQPVPGQPDRIAAAALGQAHCRAQVDAPAAGAGLVPARAPQWGGQSELSHHRNPAGQLVRRQGGEVTVAESFGRRGQGRQQFLDVRLFGVPRGPFVDPGAGGGLDRPRPGRAGRRGGLGSGPERRRGRVAASFREVGDTAKDEREDPVEELGISAGSPISVARPHQYSSPTVAGSTSVTAAANRAERWAGRQPLGAQSGAEAGSEHGEVGHAGEPRQVSPSTDARPAARAAARSSSYLSTAPRVRSAADGSQVWTASASSAAAQLVGSATPGAL